MKKFLGQWVIVILMSTLWLGNAFALEGIAEYKLGAGDQIKIHVFGEPDLDMETRLGVAGNIRYPFLGKIHVSGMRLADLEKKLTAKLANGYLIDPQVRVSIEEFRPFFVNGEVKNPGAYPYKPGLNVRKSISLAGGFNEHADKAKVFIIRENDGDKREVKILLHVNVQPGDIITVKRSFFFVNDEVKKPGKYTYHAGMTYRQAIAIAGGLTERGDDDKIYVVHDGKDDVATVDLNDSQEGEHVDNIDAEIRPGDVIFVKQSFF